MTKFKMLLAVAVLSAFVAVGLALSSGSGLANAQGYGVQYPQEERMPRTPKQLREDAQAERERRKIRASWDDRSTSQAIARLQEAAIKNNGSCDGPCISTYRCAIGALTEQIPYEQYDYYFVHPLRPGDMNGNEKETDAQYQAIWKKAVSACMDQVDQGLHRNGTIAGLELQMQAMDAMGFDKSSWIEFFRSENAISQYDPDRVEEVKGKNQEILKNIWLRQFSTNLNGNYALTRNQYDCTNKDVQVLNYVVYNAKGREVFGDYMPSKKIPMDWHNKKSEDYALYLRLCPAPPEPEKKKK